MSGKLWESGANTKQSNYCANLSDGENVMPRIGTCALVSVLGSSWSTCFMVRMLRFDIATL